MKRITYTLFIGAFVLFFAACKGGESVSTNPASLQGDWKVMAINGEEISMDKQNTHTISFNTDGTVAGKAACNVFAGNYTAQNEGMLTLNSVSTTKLECDSQKYLNAVTSTSSFQVVGGNELELSSGANTVIFTKVGAEGEES